MGATRGMDGGRPAGRRGSGVSVSAVVAISFSAALGWSQTARAQFPGMPVPVPIPPSQLQPMFQPQLQPFSQQAAGPDTASPAGQDSAGMRPGVDTSAFILRSPDSTLDGTRHFLDDAALQVQLLFQYEPSQGPSKPPPGLASQLVDDRAYAKTARGAARTIQIFTVARDAGYDLYVIGDESQSGDHRPNPDLAPLFNELRALTDAVRLRTRGLLGHEIYQLSDIQGDRALAALKALGYATIEYSASDGEDIYSHVYKPIESGERGRLPVIVRMIDSGKTSLMDAPPIGRMGAQNGMTQFGNSVGNASVPDIGGTYLHQVTSSEPQQRLLIVYDKTDPDSLARLMNLLHDKIDTPARQVVIEAQVIEINVDHLNELGVQFGTNSGKTNVGIGPDAAGNSGVLTFNLQSTAKAVGQQVQVSLQALLQSTYSEVLSSPSVLVLDDRQARIQIGQQVPVVKSTTTVTGTVSSVDYFPVGIVLNIRPRISENGQNVAMQVETIVSALDSSTSSATQTTSVVVAPVINNRQVQTFARVANNTPFIIGGLISSSKSDTNSGVPFLSEIPVIGALFGSQSRDNQKREVIVVLTPHVVPRAESSFSYVVPKDSGTFASFGYQLFRNTYRVQASDIYDLKFVTRSEAARELRRHVQTTSNVIPAIGREPAYSGVLAGQVPGEDILVRRMLWDIIHKTHYGDRIDTKRIVYFKDGVDLSDAMAYKPENLGHRLSALGRDANTLVLTFDARNNATEAHPFLQSRAFESIEKIEPANWYKRIQDGYKILSDNLPLSFVVPIGDYSAGNNHVMDALRAALLMKRILALNQSLPLTIKDFSVGRQIAFPTEEELAEASWIIDAEVARYFDEALFYYLSFEREFKRRSEKINHELDERGRARELQLGAATEPSDGHSQGNAPPVPAATPDTTQASAPVPANAMLPPAIPLDEDPPGE